MPGDPGAAPPIRIGVALADMSEFEAIDRAYGIGDQRAQVEALAASVLAGLDVDLIFRTFSSTSIEHKREIADEFAELDVLAVIGARDFTYGSVRLAETHSVPVIDVNAVPRTIFARTDPWLFTIRAAQDLVYLTYIEWAHTRGHLADRRIGVFSDRYTATSTGRALSRMEQLGYEPACHVESDGVGVGSDHDAEAARRFAESGVDLVMPFVSGSSLARMLRALSSHGIRPRILELETGEHATDVSGSVMPQEIYEGSPAIVMTRVGEVAAGRRFDPYAEQAVATFEAAVGRTLDRRGRQSSGELSNVLLVHDMLSVLRAGLLGAGAPERAPTRHQLVVALEQIEAMPSATGGRITYRSGEHWGCREMRTIEWRSGAWRVTGDYRPLVSE